MEGRTSKEIHCHSCGGVMSGDAREISYRLRLTVEHPAVPHSGLCRCQPPVVYGPPPGYRSSPGMPGMASPRAGD